MSAVNVLLGVVGLLGLFVVLAAAMTLAARTVARLVGVPNFRWFDEQPASAAWWRPSVVRLASMLAPLVVSAGLFWSGMMVAGVPQPDPGTLRSARRLRQIPAVARVPTVGCRLSPTKASSADDNWRRWRGLMSSLDKESELAPLYWPCARFGFRDSSG